MKRFFVLLVTSAILGGFFLEPDEASGCRRRLRRCGYPQTCPPPSVARPPIHPGPTTKVRALLIGLTEDKTVGQLSASALKEMEATLRKSLPKGFVEVTTLYPMVSVTNVLQAVENWNVEPSEAAFCFVICHGAYDLRLATEDRPGGHFFAIAPGQSLPRKTLFDSLTARGARLTVLLSNACNAPGQAYPTVAPKTELVGGFSPLVPLLFGHSGYIDINSSSKGELTWGLHFPIQFSSQSTRDRVARDELKDVTWNGFFKKLEVGTDTRYQAMRTHLLSDPKRRMDLSKNDPEALSQLIRQASQRPVAFELAVSSGPMSRKVLDEEGDSKTEGVLGPQTDVGPPQGTRVAHRIEQIQR